eukprot:CAMPEP_0169462082 /NCGR_PEP_ID=MMETSP1042-20121227/19371_1 /TAXON_ID=464988 /ORGANISM="Hemiselmis andersenii, Strain CCMP1180" /LENGTH=50 /DNA_ID=CAMNT_0009574697 /DNA_START=66 /DNA_END=218 /DNA_ORIENTATION=+
MDDEVFSDDSEGYGPHLKGVSPKEADSAATPLLNGARGPRDHLSPVRCEC